MILRIACQISGENRWGHANAPDLLENSPAQSLTFCIHKLRGSSGNRNCRPFAGRG